MKTTVKKLSETKIEIKSLPTKLNYYINETLDLSGLEINKKTAKINNRATTLNFILSFII